MPIVQEVQEERHTLWLCAVVSESPYTANFSFFSFERIPNYFIYIVKRGNDGTL